MPDAGGVPAGTDLEEGVLPATPPLAPLPLLPEPLLPEPLLPETPALPVAALGGAAAVLSEVLSAISRSIQGCRSCRRSKWPRLKWRPLM